MNLKDQKHVCLISCACDFTQKAGVAMPWLQSFFLLAVRLIWGYGFFRTGFGKLQHLDQVTDFFRGLGIPLAEYQAPFVGCLELVGGILIILGLGTRLISIPLMGTLIVAYLTAHREELGMLFRDPEPFMSAAPFLFLLAMVILFLFGPGFLSLDKLIRGKTCKKYSQT
ncbi:MAG: DoxX family protein [Verrucomicrobiota bacterium]|nr:DoxX family protein [Verrucomicrobiota bacterium]